VSRCWRRWTRRPRLTSNGSPIRTSVLRRRFRIGVVPQGWEAIVRRLGQRFPLESLISAGLAMRRDTGRGGAYDRFRERLMIPLIAPGGAVIGFGARALAADQEPKYLNSPETGVYHKGSFLFGFEQARRVAASAGELIVVEGYFDTIALHQVGVENVVATSGTALTADHARILKRAVSKVALTYDGDAAGQEAMLRSLGILLAAGLDVDVVELPKGEDPDALVRRSGREGWEEARRTALDPVAFVRAQSLRRPGPGDPRERGLQAVVGLAGEIADPIRRRLLLDRASQVFGVPESVVARAVTLRKAGERSAAPLRAALSARARGESFLDRQVLQALLHVPEHRDEVRAHLTPADFRDPLAAGLARALWEEGPLDPTSPEAALERELIAEALPETDWESVLQGGVRRLLRRRLESERDELRHRLEALERNSRGGSGEIADLTRRIEEQSRHISELQHHEPSTRLHDGTR
jgi:DNA primase